MGWASKIENMRLRIAGAAIGAAVLSAGGCTIAMDESRVFQPPVMLHKADTAEALRLQDEELLSSPQSRLAADPQFSGLLPAKVEHGFLNAGGERIAWTLVTANGHAPVAEEPVQADNHQAEARPLIVSCVGSGGDRPHHGAYYAEKMLPWGDVYIFDYPGYGDSTGRPTIAGIEAIRGDVVAQVEALAGDRPLVFWGHSLGGFICPYYARATSQTDAVVYENTALNSEEAGKVWKPWYLRALPFIRLEADENMQGEGNAAPLEGFEGPVLVIAGGKDKVLPAWLSRSLTAALEERDLDVTYLEFAQANHVNAPLQDDFAERASPFFARVKNLQ